MLSVITNQSRDLDFPSFFGVGVLLAGAGFGGPGVCRDGRYRIPVAVAGSTAIRTDPLAPAGHDRTWAGGSFNLVEVYPETIAVSVVPVDGAAQVFDLDAAGCAAVIAAHPTGR